MWEGRLGRWGRWWEGGPAANGRPGGWEEQQPGQEAAGKQLCTIRHRRVGGSSQVWMGQAPSSCSLISCLSAENFLRD